MPQVVSSASPDWAQFSRASSAPHQAHTLRQMADRRPSPVASSSDGAEFGTDRGEGGLHRLGGLGDSLAMPIEYGAPGREILSRRSAIPE